jgi:uncharacterized protein YegL
MNLPSPFPTVDISISRSAAAHISEPVLKIKKAGKNGTLITFVLDESGSMMSCWDQTIAGFNEYVVGQKNTDIETAGAGFLTLIKFDAPQINTVFENRPMNEVPLLNKNNYTPSGGTNLFDAVGKAIHSVNSILASIKKKDRPGVIITILTDGAENSSREYKKEQITSIVKKAELADWTFVFLGANIDSFAVGSQFGMGASNSVDYDTTNITATMASVSASTSRMRASKTAGLSTQEIYRAGLYTNEEIKNMKGN